jgi:hypothetical protein
VNSREVRDRLAEVLELALVGPRAGHAFQDERLRVWEFPSNWYLTGFLISTDTPPDQSADEDEDDDEQSVEQSAGLEEESQEERKAAKKAFFPSSMGLSFLVDRAARKLDVVVRWGDYVAMEIPNPDAKPDAKPEQVWQRLPREASVAVPLSGKDAENRLDVPDSGGLQLEVVERSIEDERLESDLPKGTRSVALFLVNRREPDREVPDRASVFQAELEVACDPPFVPRPDLRAARSDDWDDRVADLHYADAPEFATGHGVSADWEVANGVCRRIRTRWIPAAEVEKTRTEDLAGVVLSMRALGALADGAAVERTLKPLVGSYRQWIEKQRGRLAGLTKVRRETVEGLLAQASIAADRIERGIAVLAKDADALDAFRIANRSVARALQKRLRDQEPKWRAFQLAFLLLNVPELVDPLDPNRETVDLLFFPTGGGKTEAYLGLAALAMVLRRLRNPVDAGRCGGGVSVIMRYTLRLLTLDQLARAAGLVCALELERTASEESKKRYGDWPFEIGLWVGKAATPNVMGEKGEDKPGTARSKVRHFKADPRNKPSPIPLQNCPWCGHAFEADSFALDPTDDNPINLKIVCMSPDCDFTRDRPLPIVAVDEPLYRRLPAFVIATVDKFASLPWVGASGAILGGADRFDKDGYYGASNPGTGKRLSKPLPPPDLVIQDELHLISGPLGTMAGLYETAIDALCLRQIGEKSVRPKIVASTATARRAQDQVQALFGRALTQIFPPAGLDRRDSFFARTVPTTELPGRLYVGITAQGRNPKVILRRVWLALMGAAQRLYRDEGGHKNTENPVDPYMTVLGYFSSLRELGGARRILEEEVRNTLQGYGSRKRVDEEPGLFQDRRTFSEVVELTSRVSTDQIAEARRRLGCHFDQKDRVDCALATNMISVGFDEPRLGLMVVYGQPKAHAEYIQATSRVGRTNDWPGLVVTLLNVHKPRDRSHYERFRHYHETFYRSVEVSSVTPFSARALDRGMAGALVSLARHLRPDLTPALGAGRLVKERAELERQLLSHFLVRVDQQPIQDESERAERRRSVQNRVVDLLDSWIKVIESYASGNIDLKYQKYEGPKVPKPLLHEMLEEDFDTAPEHQRKFRVNRSLRDVEPSVNLVVKELRGSRSGGRR